MKQDVDVLIKKRKRARIWDPATGEPLTVIKCPSCRANTGIETATRAGKGKILCSNCNITLTTEGVRK